MQFLKFIRYTDEEFYEGFSPQGELPTFFNTGVVACLITCLLDHTFRQIMDRVVPMATIPSIT